MSVRILATIVAVMFLIQPATAQEPPDFNSYILKSVDLLARQRAGGGYNINAALTQNLSYGTDTINASNPRQTMCVAAIIEVIVEAMNLYAVDHGTTVYSKIPTKSWTKGNLAGLRANIFMYKDSGSRGTGHTLDRFGIGKELAFSQLKPGDFINLNRQSGSGHAVVFLGYLDQTVTLTKTYNDDVVGFRYFSAQGKGKPDAGFAYRNAFFGDFCPSNSGDVRRDCGVIRSRNPALLNAGRMYDPSAWRYDDAIAQIRAGVRASFEEALPDATRGEIDDLTGQAIEAEMDPTTEMPNYFDGVTTD